MKGPKFLMIMMLFVLASVCLISAPAFPGGDPWDVDGDSGSDEPDDPGSSVDSSGVPPDGDDLSNLIRSGGGFDPDWLTGIVFRVSFAIAKRFDRDKTTLSGSDQVKVEEASNSKAAW